MMRTWVPASLTLVLLPISSWGYEVETPDELATLSLAVRVVDDSGAAVPGAKVTPWALRSGQGHGPWQKNGYGGSTPPTVVTDSDGGADVPYPKYAIEKERVATIGVSLRVDHPDYGIVDDLHIDVPLTESSPYKVRLLRGVRPVVRPLINGGAADLETVYALWSDGRSWLPDVEIEKTPDGGLRLPAMAPGPQALRLVRLDGEVATHFSPIVRLELKSGERSKLDVELLPAVKVRGRLGDQAPRPVEGGRISVLTLPSDPNDQQFLVWETGTRIQPDGSFTIEGWPQGEAMQLTAFCKGYYAEQGVAPAAVRDPPDPARDFDARAQVFENPGAEVVVVPMSRTPLCRVTLRDSSGAPVRGAKVGSCPNVGWWNYGSRTYCSPVCRGETLLVERDYFAAVDEAFPYPFEGVTDADGRTIVTTLPGRQSLTVESDDCELPVFLGGRDYAIETVAGQTIDVSLTAQEKGSDQLGDWDKLAGVVFGCSTREGKQICASPGVREKMMAFRERLQSATNPRDPAILTELYAGVAEAFDDYGDAAEAAKWRERSREQAALEAGAE